MVAKLLPLAFSLIGKGYGKKIKQLLSRKNKSKYQSDRVVDYAFDMVQRMTLNERAILRRNLLNLEAIKPLTALQETTLNALMFFDMIEPENVPANQ